MPLALKLVSSGLTSDIGNIRSADQTNPSIDAIGQIERGKIAPSFESIDALTKALDIHPAELFGGLPRVPGTRHQPVQEIMDKLVTASPQQLARVRKVIDAVLDE